MSRTIRNEQEFLKQAERTKRGKHEPMCAEKDTLFYPIVLSAFGGILNESYQRCCRVPYQQSQEGQL